MKHTLILCTLLYALLAPPIFAQPSLVYAPRNGVAFVGDAVPFTLGGNAAAQNVKRSLQWAHVKVLGPGGFSTEQSFTNNVAAALDAFTFDPTLSGDYTVIWRARTLGYPFSGSNAISVLPRSLELAALKSQLVVGEPTQLTVSGSGVGPALFRSMQATVVSSLGASVSSITNTPGVFTYMSSREGVDSVRLVLFRGGIKIVEAQTKITIVSPQLVVTAMEEVILGDPKGARFQIEIQPAIAARYLQPPLELKLAATNGELLFRTNFSRVQSSMEASWHPTALGSVSFEVSVAQQPMQPPLCAKGGVKAVSNGLDLLAEPAVIRVGESVRLYARSKLEDTATWMAANRTRIRLSQAALNTFQEIPLDVLLNRQTLPLASPGIHRFRVATPSGISEASVRVEVLNDGIPTQPTLERPMAPGLPFTVTVPVPKLPFKAVEIGFLVDKSASMANEISAMRAAAAEIYAATREVALDVKAQVFTYAGKTRETAGFGHPIGLTSNPRAIAELNLEADGPGNEAPFASLLLAARSPGWNNESAKILLLLTDDIDHFYASRNRSRIVSMHYNRPVSWSFGPLSAVDIMKELASRDFMVGALISPDQVTELTEEYQAVLSTGLGSNSLGAYKLESKQALVDQFRLAVKKLVLQKATLRMRERAGEGLFLDRIRPLQPDACIQDGGFSYAKLTEAGVTQVTFECVPGKSLPDRAALMLEAVNQNNAVVLRQPVLRLTSP